MVLGGWKKPLFGFLLVNLIVFWGFYLSGLPFSYLYDENLSNYYFEALIRETFLYFLIFLIFPDFDLRQFSFKGEKILFYLSILFLIIELFLSDFKIIDYADNSDKGTPFFELGSLLFVLSSWKKKFLSKVVLLGLVLIVLLTVLSGKRMALSFVIMKFLFLSSLKLSHLKYFFIVFLFFLLLTFSSFLREYIFDLNFIIENGILSSNHGGVLHSAAVYLEAEQSLEWYIKAQLFFYNLIAPWFISLSLLPIESSINLYFINNFREIQGNGGFISSYLKFFGVDYYFLVIVGFIFRVWKKKIFIHFLTLSIFIICNRFFYYNLASSIRLISLTIIVYFFMTLLLKNKNP